MLYLGESGMYLGYHPSHEAIPLVVGEGTQWSVHRYLLELQLQTMMDECHHKRTDDPMRREIRRDVETRMKKTSKRN